MPLVIHKPYPVARDEDLAQIPSNLTRNPKKIYKARPVAIQALEKLCGQAEKDGAQIVVISSHRTYDFQKNYFLEAEARHGKGKGALWVAPAGFSEHHTGFVFDLADKTRPETDDEPTFESTRASDWLKANAERFGFELSFPPKNWQGVSYEPWHWRYAGDPEAKKNFHPPFLKRAWVIVESVLAALFR